jgi:SHS family lactate transporter-like MFS transporter
MSTLTVAPLPHAPVNQTRNDWNALIASFLGWTLDAFDYFVVVMVLTEIGAEFHKTNAEIALTLMLTLAFRPLGAFIFGLLADRYGRRLPLMIDVIAYSVIEVASGFAPNFTVFLILRALFGIAMGGEWGVGASLAMESVPAKWRGVLSGLLQQGYALGYMLASFAYFFILPHFGWRSMFFIGGAPALLTLFIRRNVKESKVWETNRRKDWSELWSAVKSHAWVYVAFAAAGTALAYIISPAFFGSPFGIAIAAAGVSLIAVMADMTWKVAAGHRKLFLYLVLFLTFMGFASHGTQDMYPTFLKTQRGFSPQGAAVLTIIANVGALAGGILIGFFSDRFGRRKSMILAFIFGIAVIPLWAFSPGTALLAAGAFLLQFAVQGAWGIVPAQMTELTPDHLRGFIPGFAYQCGILLAGSVAYIEAIFASRVSYSNAMALTALVVFAGACIVIASGREKCGIEFGKEGLR